MYNVLISSSIGKLGLECSGPVMYLINSKEIYRPSGTDAAHGRGNCPLAI